MEKYFEEKQKLVKQNIVSIIKKYDPYAVNETEFDYNYIAENELPDKLVQFVNYQNKRIAYLERQLAELQENNDLMLEDTEKLNVAYETICKDIVAEKVPKKDIGSTPVKLAMFTPMPPLKNGIADYSVKIINELCIRFDIDVFVDNGYIVNKRVVPNNCNIFYHNQFETKKNEYDLIIFHIGNNPDHVYMIPYILKYPGIIVLHDFVLEYLRLFLNKNLQNFCDSNKSKIDYNNRGIKEPCNLYLLKNTSGVIVHSHYSEMGILEQDISRNVKVIPHFSELTEGFFDKKILREKYNFSENEIVISSFGFVTVTKRIPSALVAFAKIVEEHPGLKLRYCVVGQVDEDQFEIIQHIVKKYNLKDRVTFVGYASPETFDEYIELSDICVNLRYPYGGESSGTLAKILGKGKPSIITDVGAFSEIPDECCIKLPYDTANEINELFSAMEKLIMDPELCVVLGENGKRYVKNELSLKKVGEEYTAFIQGVLSGENNTWPIKLKRMSEFIAHNSFHNTSFCVDWLVENLLKEM